MESWVALPIITKDDFFVLGLVFGLKNTYPTPKFRVKTVQNVGLWMMISLIFQSVSNVIFIKSRSFFSEENENIRIKTHPIGQKFIAFYKIYFYTNDMFY